MTFAPTQEFTPSVRKSLAQNVVFLFLNLRKNHGLTASLIARLKAGRSFEHPQGLWGANLNGIMSMYQHARVPLSRIFSATRYVASKLSAALSWESRQGACPLNTLEHFRSIPLSNPGINHILGLHDSFKLLLANMSI